MIQISKSNYLSHHQCPRQFYLEKHMPNVSLFSNSLKRRMLLGQEVGLLAKQLFNQVEDVAYQEDKDLMIEETKRLIDQGKQYISEASFKYNQLFCSVDILEVTNEGFNIYEVKSSTSISKDYEIDIAFQYYVLLKAGYHVSNAYIIHIDKTYQREEQLDLSQLFKIELVNDLVFKHLDDIEHQIKKISHLTEEPLYIPVSHCSKCPFYDYCHKDLPEDSLVNLYNYRRKNKYYKLGLRTFQDILDYDKDLTVIQKRQIDYYYNDHAMFVDKRALFNYLSLISYPLYFLDFETLDYPIPPFKGVFPNQRLPFQVSIHRLSDDHTKLDHHDILITPDKDPRERMCLFLIEQLADSGSILVYNASFEKSVIKVLANQFPQYKKALLDINLRIIDLLDVFKEGMVYKKEMGGSFSIKVVYPAMSEENLYKALDNVHNGTEAMDALEQLNDLPELEKNQLINDLKAYCRLDTLSMVHIYLKLLEIVNT